MSSHSREDTPMGREGDGVLDIQPNILSQSTYPRESLVDVHKTLFTRMLIKTL